MNETQLRAFVTVHDCGGFASAARVLHMSQPGVSRAVRALEVELGGELFLRSHGSVALTGLGERVLARSRTILAEADAMRQERYASPGVIQGRVRLGSMPSVSATILPLLLAHLERHQPGLAVTTIDGHDEELVTWLRTDVVDIAVVAGQPTGLSIRPLVTDTLLAVLPATHPLAARDSIRAQDLRGQPFILTKAGCETLILATLTSRDVTPDVKYEVSEAATILAMVAEGLGVSVMPGLAAQSPPSNVALRPLRPNARRQLGLAVMLTQPASPAIEAFLAEADRIQGTLTRRVRAPRSRQQPRQTRNG
ncbi:MAG: LysR substrate-binding domain-containing protein [Actinomycetota bacterium]|nr:LysR substrate-binding domain-containing protein [Actinomycetota bacterium]MDA8073423.1 LysR substrate-binding domain-containing protein [Actinomycetota bacterium]